MSTRTPIQSVATHPEATNDDPTATRACEHCGEPYEPYVRKAGEQRFCSTTCRKAAWDAQHRPRIETDELRSQLEALKRQVDDLLEKTG